MNIVHRGCLFIMLLEITKMLRHTINPELYPVSGFGVFGVMVVLIFILTPRDLFE